MEDGLKPEAGRYSIFFNPSFLHGLGGRRKALSMVYEAHGAVNVYENSLRVGTAPEFIGVAKP